MSGDGGVSTDIKLSPEAEAILSNELRLFAGDFLPRQEQGIMETLKLVGPGPNPFAKEVGKIGDVVGNATENAGIAGGMESFDYAPVVAQLADENPELFRKLVAYGHQVVQGQGELIDPRFAQFLSPETTQKQSAGAQNAIALGGTAASIGLGIAAIA